MNIIFHGHSCVEIRLQEHTVLIDPFLDHNPVADVKAKDVKADFIIVTHGHGDHVGDTVEIAKNNNATVIATNDLSRYFSSKGINAHAMGIGGHVKFPFGSVKLTMAMHDSSYVEPGTTETIYTGLATGVLIYAEGKTLFHAGDTGLFMDMQLIGQLNSIDLAFLPIGDNFTMGPDDAVLAAQFLNAKSVVPIHYNTFPLLNQDPYQYAGNLAERGIKGIIMEPGQNLEL